MLKGLSKKNLELLNQAGPRYTSYPPIPQWKEDYNPEQLTSELEALGSKDSVALYLHIPFCEKRCHFCACHKIIDPGHTQAAVYVEHLLKEIEICKTLAPGNPEVVQVHWGGGTPTFLQISDIRRIHDKLIQNFPLGSGAEIAMEVNPATTLASQIEGLAQLGFTRLSFGVQDFDLEVQRAINRDQSFEQTKSLYDLARQLGFAGINFDLIYGLPRQNITKMQQTLKLVMDLGPDRIALYSFALVPWKHPFQRRFDSAELPNLEAKLSLYNYAAETLQAFGYVRIGMDHFAKPGDPLAIAAQKARLHRNFMGYTTLYETPVIGFGVSAISSIGNIYAQNEKALPAYYNKIAQGQLPTARGMTLGADDLIRRDLIEEILCNFRVDLQAFQKKHRISFWEYFQTSKSPLIEFQKLKLINFNQDVFIIEELGRLFARNIAMCFDRYLQNDQTQTAQYSRTI